jgi:transglycosylase-like protein with SLT domain
MRETVDLKRGLQHVATLVVLVCIGALPVHSIAGTQEFEPLADSVKNALHAAISDQAPVDPIFPSMEEKIAWLTGMSQRLVEKIPNGNERLDFLKAVHYEATRAGLDPQLLLGLIEVLSNFRRYAVSPAGARGYMQVMPFWTALIGSRNDNLFHLRTNLRYGCSILRHYLDIEQGDLYRALGRYVGSAGQSEFPLAVENAWKLHWNFSFAVLPAATRAPVSAYPSAGDDATRVKTAPNLVWLVLAFFIGLGMLPGMALWVFEEFSIPPEKIKELRQGDSGVFSSYISGLLLASVACILAGAYGWLKVGTWFTPSVAWVILKLGEGTSWADAVLSGHTSWVGLQQMSDWYLQQNIGWTLLATAFVVLGILNMMEAKK